MQKFFDQVIKYSILWVIPWKVEPNHVTVLRFLLIPFVLYFLLIESNLITIILFVIAVLTDAVDGALARTRDKITDWGKLYDPLADKLLIGTVVAIVVTKYVDIFVAGAIILIEMLLIIVALYRKRIEGKKVEAIWIGKLKMVLQSFAVGLVLLYILLGAPWLIAVATLLLYVSIVLGSASLVVYGAI